MPTSNPAISKALNNNTYAPAAESDYIPDNSVLNDSTDILDREPIIPNQIIEQTTRLSKQACCSQSAFTGVKKRSLTTYTPGFKQDWRVKQMQKKLLPVRARDKEVTEYD